MKGYPDQSQESDPGISLTYGCLRRYNGTKLLYDKVSFTGG